MEHEEQICNIRDFLEKSVYYPACNFDWYAINALKDFTNFVYSDYAVHNEDDYREGFSLKEGIKDLECMGYVIKSQTTLEAKDLFGINWIDYYDRISYLNRPLSGSSGSPFAEFYSLECVTNLNENVKRDINLLYIKSEGIAAYKYLYIRRGIVPLCLVSIHPCGGNFPNYPQIFIDNIISSGKFPEYCFYDDMCGHPLNGWFSELIRYYEIISKRYRRRNGCRECYSLSILKN